MISSTDTDWHGKPLWVVFGHDHQPTIMSCVLRAYTATHKLLPLGQSGDVVIWGYSVWRGRAGYRTLGLRLSEWAKRFSLEPVFFASHDEAIEHVRQLTRVSVLLMKRMDEEAAEAARRKNEV